MLAAKKIITRRRVLAAIAFAGAIIFSLILLNWSNVHSVRQSLFVASALNGNVGRMKLLLAVGADVNDFECQRAGCWTPLFAAAAAGQFEAVQLLLARGADVNKKLSRGQTPLMIASYHGDTKIVRLLLSNGADPNADCEGDTALTWAKQKGHTEIVNLLTAPAKNPH